MKILHVLAQLPSRTGSGVYFSNLVENFKKYNYEQKVVFGTEDDFKWDLLDEKDIYPVEFKTEELPFPIVGMSDIMPYDNTLYSEMTDEMFDKWINAFKKRLISIKEKYSPDIIFTHHLWILSSIVAEIFTDSKIIGICHNTDMRQAQMNPAIYNKYAKNLGKLDLIFALSENQIDEIANIYQDIERDNIISVGGGFNQNIFFFPEKKEYNDKIRLVYSAKIDPSKGIYELLKVYKELNLDDVSLDIIGVPDERNKKELEKYIKDDKGIKVYNVKDQIALGEELRKKDIFLMPSFYEGLGLMAIESLASGLYVVTTEIEALMTLLGKDIEESGIIKYVPLPRIYDVDKPVEEDLPKFRENLKEAILTQIEKVRNRKSCLIDEKDKIKQFSWESLVDKINEIIKQ
ncbi:glycosyltransferase family 4 protein [Tissierella sp.]|uniref:glycosyltransferase family 4 protein n=1 Tax=Tissierella sp. TaxID=41274 RepID=UPI00285533B6|nr:glycosyltransferase family 4 protein [Tissierella sp.]MDR7855273.1 glycosyltransferase family 4 protein [Tissierella sp.]